MEALTNLAKGVYEALIEPDSDVYDPFGGVELSNVGRGNLSARKRHERDIESIVRDAYEEALNAVDAESDEMTTRVPAKRHFLVNTFISFYFCGFREETPHQVRWILRHSVLAEYIHHTKRRDPAPQLGVYRRGYGAIGQYPENTVKEAIDELRGLCEYFNLAVAEEWDNERELDEDADDDNNNNNEDGDDRGASHAHQKGDDSQAGSESDGDAVALDRRTEDADTGNGGDSLYNKVIESDEELARQIYEETKLLMPPTRKYPKTIDLYYNMAYSLASSHNNQGTQKIWWIVDKHVYSRILRRLPMADSIKTQYGTCCIYDDYQIQRAILVARRICEEFGFEFEDELSARDSVL